MNAWHKTCAGWEARAEGLLLSFIGKLPGMAARLSLVLAGIAHAFDGADDPRRITPAEFGRACHFLAEYALPMAAVPMGRPAGQAGNAPRGGCCPSSGMRAGPGNPRPGGGRPDPACPAAAGSQGRAARPCL